jgi:hypothetical protein
MIIEKTCPNCSKPAIFDFNEKIVGDKLFWSASLTCPACGYAVEMDDKGSLPEHLRSQVIAEEGLWELEISSEDTYTLKTIHQVMQISIDELAKLKKQIPCVVYQGTENELRFFFNQLLKCAPNIEAVMRKAAR